MKGRKGEGNGGEAVALLAILQERYLSVLMLSAVWGSTKMKGPQLTSRKHVEQQDGILHRGRIQRRLCKHFDVKRGALYRIHLFLCGQTRRTAGRSTMNVLAVLAHVFS
ncbi:unnamed protein product [Ectocarpus sp. 12 AP-2014]